MNEGKDNGAAEAIESLRAAFDPLLDDFASRYVFPWEQRELGRVASPVDLREQLDEAEELFNRARSRWEGFDMFAWSDPGDRKEICLIAAPREREGDLGWDARTLELAREAHRFLLTHTAYDLSRPEDLNLTVLQGWLRWHVSMPVLWASVAMRCAVDAADECYRLSHVVEGAALKWRKVNLAELHEADNDLWYDRIRDVLRDLAGDVAEAREYIATYLGAARTALVLANSAEANEALREVEMLNAELRAEIEKKGVALSSSMAARVAAEQEAEERRARDRERQQAGARANEERAKKTAETVRELWGKYSKQFPQYSDDRLCERIAEDIESPRSKPGSLVYMSKSAIRKIAERCGLLGSRKVARLSENPSRDSNTVK
jgi:hypothetical protein